MITFSRAKTNKKGRNNPKLLQPNDHSADKVLVHPITALDFKLCVSAFSQICPVSASPRNGN
jgi:hypothetical protein